MISSRFLRAIVLIVSIVFAIGAWVTTGAPNTSLFSLFSVAVFVCTILIFLWDKWIWKWKIAQAIPSVNRDVSGTWKGEIESFWVDPKTNKRPPKKPTYLVIRQTSSTISVTLISEESTSKSSLARVAEEDGSWCIHYIYMNQPRLENRARSPIHHGSAIISIVGSPAKSLTGSYWTDRDSKGQYVFKKRSKKISENLKDAQEAFRRPRKNIS